MTDQERLDALEVALNNEMHEREFYLKHAARTRNPIGRRMFQEIADDELEHYERLKELHDTWTRQEKWPASLPLKVKDTAIKEILTDMITQVEDQPESDTDDLKAIEIATDFEYKGTQFYARLRDASRDPKERAFFDLLARIEREHYLSLKDTEIYLKDPEAYFTEKEHHGLDGA